MTIKKLVAGAKGASGNSTGADIADAVNGLIDSFAINYNPNNITSIQPWRPAPAHAFNTTYSVGQAVTSSGNTYLCLTAGTTGGASAPTATTNNEIVDGTVRWLYYGVAPTALADAPTVTVVGSTPAGQTKVVLSDSAESWFTVKGGAYTFGANGPEWNNAVEPRNTFGYCIEFMTDSLDFTVVFRFGAVPIRFAVDGRFVTPSVLTASGTNRFRIQMSGDRKQRLIQMYWAGANGFYAVNLNPIDSVWKPDRKGDINLFVVGDSYIGGSAYHPVTVERSIRTIIAESIGARQYQADGVGGSGYISSGSGQPYGDPVRIARVSASSNLVIVLGGINDPLAGLQDAVSNYLSLLRARVPTAVIIVGGVWGAVSGPNSETLNKEQAIKNAVTATNDSKIIFMPISSAISPFISGTGRVSATNNTGNADIYQSPDGTHPIAQATSYLADRIVSFISSIDLN